MLIVSRRAWKRTCPHAAPTPAGPGRRRAAATRGARLELGVVVDEQDPLARGRLEPRARPRRRSRGCGPAAGRARSGRGDPVDRCCRRPELARRAGRGRRAGRCRQASSSGPPRCVTTMARTERHAPVRLRDPLERVRERQPARVGRVPRRRRGAQCRARPRARARSRPRGPRATSEAATNPLTPSSISSVAALSGSATTTARRARRARLDDHEPVALAPRGEHQAERAPQRGVDLRVGSTKPGRRHPVLEPVLARSAPARARARARRRRSRRAGSGSRGERGHQRRHPLLRDVPAGEHDDGPGST